MVLLLIAFWLTNKLNSCVRLSPGTSLRTYGCSCELCLLYRQEHNKLPRKIHVVFFSYRLWGKKKRVLQDWHIQVNLSHRKLKALILILKYLWTPWSATSKYGLCSAKRQQRFSFSICGKDLHLYLRSWRAASRYPWLVVQLYLQR